MSLLKELRRQRNLYVRCPNCDEAVRLRDAKLFDATETLPEYASHYLADQRNELKRQRNEFSARKENAKSRPRLAAESTGIGKIVERIAPSLPGFPARASDCRSLFDPIDYIVFRGLTAKGRVEQVQFVDVKSGSAKLSSIQREIKAVVESGKVRLLIAPRPNQESV